MSKFEVGDRVKIVAADESTPRRDHLVGRVGVVGDMQTVDGEVYVAVDGLEGKLKERFMGIHQFAEHELVRA